MSAFDLARLARPDRDTLEVVGLDRKPASSSAAPIRLNKYELIRPIGAGGMAEVHLARTRGAYGIEKLLVVKRILPELVANKRFVRMFLDEARLAVALSHANIVQVYEVDEVDGVVFYAMELLHGCDVRHISRALRRARVRLELGQAVAIVLAMAAGLHYAHEMTNAAGEPLAIVHRDVSPHNVFVCFDGGVKVIDFGIAKVADRIDRTATGMLKGKFGYMSPEQCLGQRLDRRSDVFCIAVMLYELTTGTRLYAAASEYEMLKRIIETDPPPPRAVDPHYPLELERIVIKGLKRDPAARYQTAEALAADLETVARAMKLDTSQASVARFMERLFPSEVAQWRAGGARSALDILSRRLEEETSSDETVDSEARTLSRPSGVDTKSGSVTETLDPAPGGATRRRWAITGAAASLAVALGAVAWFGSHRSRGNDNALASSDPSPPAAPSSAPPPTFASEAPSTSAEPPSPGANRAAVSTALSRTPAPTPITGRAAVPRTPIASPRARATTELPRRPPDPDSPLPR